VRDLTTLPTAHLHVHLEGTVRPATPAALARASVDASFAPPATRRALHAGIGAWPAVSPAAG
jgi:hypothetical protein